MGEYGLHNTPAGMKQIIDAAIKVCPAIANLAIERTWAGLRPVTPDTFPVLGASSRCANLFVAGGYWRNGVLLAPKTAQLVADAVCGCMSVQDEEFARAFAMDRFTVPPREARHSGTEHRHEVRASASAEASPSELLEMERAALEGANDGSMLSDLSGLFGKPPVAEEKVRRRVHWPTLTWNVKSTTRPRFVCRVRTHGMSSTGAAAVYRAVFYASVIRSGMLPVEWYGL